MRTRSVVPGRTLGFFVHHAGDPVSSYLKNGLVWHPAITRFLTRQVRSGSVFVDVGAHIGYFAVLAAAAGGPDTRVIAFEPDRDNADLLVANAKLNDVAIDIRRRAIGPEATTAALHRSTENRALQSLVPEARHDPEAAATVEVSTLRRELGDLDRVDFLKLDIQGLEPMLFDRPTIEWWSRFPKPPHVILEVNPRTWVERDPGFEALNAFRARYRYDLHLFLPGEAPTVFPPSIRWSTFLALCADLREQPMLNPELDVLLYPPPRTPPPPSARG